MSLCVCVCVCVCVCQCHCHCLCVCVSVLWWMFAVNPKLGTAPADRCSDSFLSRTHGSTRVSPTCSKLLSKSIEGHRFSTIQKQMSTLIYLLTLFLSWILIWPLYLACCCPAPHVNIKHREVVPLLSKELELHTLPPSSPGNPSCTFWVNSRKRELLSLDMLPIVSYSSNSDWHVSICQYTWFAKPTRTGVRSNPETHLPCSFKTPHRKYLFRQQFTCVENQRPENEAKRRNRTAFATVSLLQVKTIVLEPSCKNWAARTRRSNTSFLFLELKCRSPGFFSHDDTHQIGFCRYCSHTHPNCNLPLASVAFSKLVGQGLL